MTDDHTVTTGELARSLYEFRRDTSQSMHGLRNEMTSQLGKLDLAIDDLAGSMARGYVSSALFEEIRRNQGERIGQYEQRLTRAEETSAARYDAIVKRLEDKDKEGKADRRLVITALVAPFIMLVIGLVLTAVFVQ